MTTIHTLDVAGARLHYEVRGEGPLLLLIGSPMGAAAFAPIADALAADHTVVTHDPRGMGRSRLDDPGQDSTPELRAPGRAGRGVGRRLRQQRRRGDRARPGRAPPGPGAHRGGPRAPVAGTAPRRGRTPRRSRGHDRDVPPRGSGCGLDEVHGQRRLRPGGRRSRTASGESAEQDLADGARFFAHELRHTTRFVPDVPALAAGPARIVVGIGAGSGGLVTYSTSVALAERLGVAPVEFPGDHGGFVGETAAFAGALRRVLDGAGVPPGAAS